MRVRRIIGFSVFKFTPTPSGSANVIDKVEVFLGDLFGHWSSVHNGYTFYADNRHPYYKV